MEFSLRMVLKLAVLLVAIGNTLVGSTQGMGNTEEYRYPYYNFKQVQTPVCCPRIPECCRPNTTKT